MISGGLALPRERAAPAGSSPSPSVPGLSCTDVVLLSVVCRSLVAERTLPLNYSASYLLLDVPTAHVFRIRL